jgi:hypothetical protein
MTVPEAASAIVDIADAHMTDLIRRVTVERGLDPSRFTIRTIPRRLDRLGDLWGPVLGPGVDLGACLERLERISPDPGGAGAVGVAAKGRRRRAGAISSTGTASP